MTGAATPVPADTGGRAEFAALPRALFLPELIWPYDTATGTCAAVDRRTDPGRWRAAASADIPVVTQWDDGRHTGPEPGTVPTSSASMPSVVAGMLEAAAPVPGMRVLEIGTGTGWTAGLLARRLGAGAVTTVEVDDAVAAAARAALDAAGLRPRVVTGDGLAGVPDGAPYDRLISTVGVRDIPAAWPAQVRPGGLLVAPWGTHYSNADVLVVLTVAGDGTASGPFLRPLEFMKARSHRLVLPDFAGELRPVDDSATGVGLPLYGPWHPFTFAADLLVPGVTHAVRPLDDGGRALWLYALDGAAWAVAERPAGAGVTRVRQAGKRRLWNELLAAHAWWTAVGRPGVERFGLTVTPGARTAWLDSPAHPLGDPPLPAAS